MPNAADMRVKCETCGDLLSPDEASGEDFPERFRAAFRRADEHRRDNPNHLAWVTRLPLASD
jgi:hypothetical protein